MPAGRSWVWRTMWMNSWSSDKIRRAFGQASQIPIAGTPTAPAFNGELQVGLLFLDDAIALRAMDAYSKYPLLIPALPASPQKVWDVISQLAVCNFRQAEVHPNG